MLLSNITTAQSDLANVLKAGEVVLNGFTIFKVAKSETKKNSKVVSVVCVKNKLLEKINFNISGNDEEGNEVKREMVIPSDGKEYVFNIPKGIYSYQVIFFNKVIYQKGEY